MVPSPPRVRIRSIVGSWVVELVDGGGEEGEGGGGEEEVEGEGEGCIGGSQIRTGKSPPFRAALPSPDMLCPLDCPSILILLDDRNSSAARDSM